MTAKKPKKPPAALRDHDARVKARALVEAETRTDVDVAARYGISTRTLERWRHDLATDGELASAHRRIMQRAEDGFIAKAAEAFNALATRIIELAPTMDAHDTTIALERCGDLLVQARALGRAGDADGEPEDDRQSAALGSDRASAVAGTTH